MTTPTQNLVAAIISGDAQEIQQNFTQAMANKVLDRIETTRQDVAQTMFNPPVQEPSYEEDPGYEESDDSYNETEDYDDSYED
jgi:hypothetical protein